jgi:MFS family permease
LAPTVLFSLFAGVIADSLSRRKIVMITQEMMGVVALAFALITLTDMIQLWHIYLLLAVHGSAFIFDLPARYSLTPNLVSSQDLPNALSVELLGIPLGSLVGPVLSGVIMGRLGQSTAYFTSALLFTVMLVALLLMKVVPQEKLKQKSSEIDWRSIKTGIDFTIRHPLIFPGLLWDFMATFLTRADSLMPFFAREILGLNVIQYGLLSAASAIGAVTSGAVLSQLRTIRHQGRKLIGAVGVIGLGAIIFGFSRNFLLSMTALIIIGASDSVSSIFRSSIRQSHTPDHLRGRMTSVNQIFFMGGPYIGYVKSGFIGGLIGVPLAVGIGGILCVFSVGWVARLWSLL